MARSPLRADRQWPFFVAIPVLFVGSFLFALTTGEPGPTWLVAIFSGVLICKCDAEITKRIKRKTGQGEKT